jgi:hypothetical protein
MDPFGLFAHFLPAPPHRTDGGLAAAGHDSALISATAGHGRPIQNVSSNIGPNAELEKP